MRSRMGAAMVVAGLLAVPAAAQEQIQWKQVLNVAKGANLPPGVKWDIVGIELGETYAVVRPRLDALLAEGIPQKRPKDETTAKLLGQDLSPPIEEGTTVIQLPLPSGGSVEAKYPGHLALKREMKGSGPRTIAENIRVQFSAPSSGHQVVSVSRFVNYYEHADQPRIGELIKSIAAKYGAAPQVTKAERTTQLELIFDNGRVFVPTGILDPNACKILTTQAHSQGVREINGSGKCDVVLTVTINHGISDDHASTITFALGDFERAKANLGADYGFFDTYVSELRKRTSGAAPKL